MGSSLGRAKFLREAIIERVGDGGEMFYRLFDLSGIEICGRALADGDDPIGHEPERGIGQASRV